MGKFACPYCLHPKSTVMCFTDGTKANDVRFEVYRYRKCHNCNVNFKTCERIVPIERKPAQELKKWSDTFKGKHALRAKGVDGNGD